MSYAVRVTEDSTLEGAIATTGSIGSWYTDAIDLSVARRHLFEIVVPTLSGGATVSFGVQTATTSGGSYTALTGASIATESTGGKVFQIEVANEFIKNAVSGALFMKGYLQIATATATSTVTCRGFEPTYHKTSDSASTAQTPNVLYA